MKKTKLIPFDRELALKGAKLLAPSIHPIDQEIRFQGVYIDKVHFLYKKDGEWHWNEGHMDNFLLEVEVKIQKLCVAIGKDSHYNVSVWESKDSLLRRGFTEKKYTFH